MIRCRLCGNDKLSIAAKQLNRPLEELADYHRMIHMRKVLGEILTWLERGGVVRSGSSMHGDLKMVTEGSLFEEVSSPSIQIVTEDINENPDIVRSAQAADIEIWPEGHGGSS